MGHEPTISKPGFNNNNPVGSLDIVEGKTGSVFVRGWAFDPNDTSKQLDIHVYIGADSIAGGGESHAIKANLERADVNKIYGCGNNHGFSTEVQTGRTGRQTVYVFAINVGAGGNVMLGSATVNIAEKPHVHELMLVPAKAPTVAAEGNIAYWTCNSCGKIYKDSAANTEISKSETVIPKLVDVANATVSVFGSYVYNGSAQTPAAGEVAVELNGTTLKAGADYTITCANNVNAGTAAITVEGEGSYGGTKSVPFTISPAPLVSARVSVSNQQYTGKAIFPSPSVDLDGKTLLEGTDYTLSYGNNVNVGAATVTVTGQGNYTGSQSVRFQIDPAPILSASVSVADQVYTGSPLTPELTVKLSSATLIRGVDYMVDYQNNTAVGTATVIVTGIGNYTGSKSATFAIVPQDLPQPTESVVMHRLYNPNSGEHFYTSDAGERDGLVGLGWSHEGVGWTAPASSGTPVYRMYNPNAGDHHYTADASERDSLAVAGWKYEGVGWYSDDGRGTALLRLYNPNAPGAGAHHYTTSDSERDMLVRAGWRFEGVGWYGV